MSYEPKDNSGALFKNDKKEKDSHPDYRGDALINGTEYWISAWLKEGKRGKFFSFSFKPKDDREGKSVPKLAAKQPQKTAFDDMPDDIPF